MSFYLNLLFILVHLLPTLYSSLSVSSCTQFFIPFLSLLFPIFNLSFSSSFTNSILLFIIFLLMCLVSWWFFFFYDVYVDVCVPCVDVLHTWSCSFVYFCYFLISFFIFIHYHIFPSYVFHFLVIYFISVHLRPSLCSSSSVSSCIQFFISFFLSSLPYL